MTIYTLNFTIDTAGVEAINGAGQSITIAKSVAGGGTTPVAWLAFEAAQTIQVTWEENYWIYATNTQVQAGAQILSTAITDEAAVSGKLYTFESTQIFSPPTPPAQPVGTFDVTNQVGNNSWLFGLAQMAKIAGKDTPNPVPLNIVSALNNETLTFTPEVTVSIFLQSVTNNGVVISQIESNALVVTLTSAAPSASIGFNDSLNQFNESTAEQLAAANPSRRRGFPKPR